MYVLLWEYQNVVWVRAATPNTEFPVSAAPITDIWDDTGISVPTLNTGLPVSEKVVSIREGNLSPLAIKRLPPKLHKQQTAQKVYKTLKERLAQLQRDFRSRYTYSCTHCLRSRHIDEHRNRSISLKQLCYLPKYIQSKFSRSSRRTIPIKETAPPSRAGDQ